MRGTMLLAATLLATATIDGQDLGARVRAVRDGTVRFEYPADDGVCGNGRGNISIRNGRGRTTGTGDARSAEWEDACEAGPVRVALSITRGTVTDVRAYVGGRWRGAADADLGAVPATEATEFLLGVVERGGDEAAKAAIFPAIIAAGETPWRRLLAVAKDGARPREVRSAAVFWVGQGAADAATAGLQEFVDADGDREVRQSAVFAISQRPADEAVPALIRIARSHRDPGIRRSAIFWLGQTRDARAIAYFEEVLTSR